MDGWLQPTWRLSVYDMRCTQIGRHKINSIYDILAKNLKAVADRYRSSSVEGCCTQTTVSCVSISFFLFLPVDYYGVAQI